MVERVLSQELFAGAVFTLESCPNGIELVDSRFHEGVIICQDAGFEVMRTCALHPYAGSGEVGRADIGGLQGLNRLAPAFF